MKKYFYLLLACVSLAFSAQGVFSPIQTLPASYSQGMTEFYTTYNPKDNTIFMTWPDNTLPVTPWFAIYDCKSGNYKFNPTQINSSSNSITITSSYNSKNNTMLITWKNTSGYPWYAIYDCSSQNFLIQPTQISSQFTVSGDIYSCYNPQNNTFFITWLNSPSMIYTVLDCSSNSFTPLAELGQIELSQDIIPTFNSYNNTIFLTSNDISSSPCYAIFNPSSLSLTTPFTRFPGYSDDCYSNLNCCYLTRQKQMFMTWTNGTQNSAYYAIYDTINNTLAVQPTLIPGSGSITITGDVIPCYDSINNSVLMSWANNEGAYYAIYNIKNRSFSEQGSIIPNSDTYDTFFNVQPIFNQKLKNVAFSWTTGSQNTAAFTFYMFKKHAIKKSTYTSPIIYQKGA